MEPLSAALTFSSIVGLIGQFRSERGGRSQTDFNAFLVWLSETQHEDIRALLEKNHQAVDAVKVLLLQQQDVLLNRLDNIDSLLVSVTSAFHNFRELGLAIKPAAALSSNALSILRQFESSGSSRVLERKTYDGNKLNFLETGGEIQVEDERFLEDDIRTLVDLELLRHDQNENGRNIYIFTRQASELVRRLYS